MIKIIYNIIDFCSWADSSEQYEKRFENENDLQKYIDDMHDSMFGIHIIEKTEE